MIRFRTPIRFVIITLVLALLTGAAIAQPAATAKKPELPLAPTPVATVYMSKKITPEAIQAIYKAVGRTLPGKVAVKLSTGEPGGSHYLSPDLIKGLVQSVKGTIVECNTAYGGPRSTTEQHKKVAIDHGFTAIAPVDILDEDSSIALPFPHGAHIREDLVGSRFLNYGSYLILSHFKGHAMGGFGGALKNISIGFASSKGKTWIHTAGASTTDFMLAFRTNQNAFLESMAEAAGAIMKSAGDNIVYINVMNKLSVDCDCDGNPAPPEMDDIGILASTDPVALDRACVDLVYAADKEKSASLRQRIESRNGTLILQHAEALGIGYQKYTLVRIDK